MYLPMRSASGDGQVGLEGRSGHDLKITNKRPDRIPAPAQMRSIGPFY